MKKIDYTFKLSIKTVSGKTFYSNIGGEFKEGNNVDMVRELLKDFLKEPVIYVYQNIEGRKYYYFLATNQIETVELLKTTEQT